MRHMSFMVLTGHLNDFALPDLVRTLHGQRKTGRLQIDYPELPAAFYFEGGQLVDAQLGDLKGLEALFAALGMPGASFNFNPLVRPPKRTVAEHERKALQELLAGTNEPQTLEALTTAGKLESRAGQPATAALPPAANNNLAVRAFDDTDLIVKLNEIESTLAAQARRFSRERAVYAILIAALLLLTFAPRPWERARQQSAAQSSELTNHLPPAGQSGEKPLTAGTEQSAQINPAQASAPPLVKSGPQERPGKEPKAKPAQEAARQPAPAGQPSTKVDNEAAKSARTVPPQTSEAVRVLVRVEHGEVTQATVENSRPGMKEFEALAVKIARQRRYPDDFSGQTTLQIRMKP
jgi:hypothetical protein